MMTMNTLNAAAWPYPVFWIGSALSFINTNLFIKCSIFMLPSLSNCPFMMVITEEYLELRPVMFFDLFHCD